ncbi:MAG TPA: hypothetical protein VFJ12_06780 [Segeticoccus sp.]|jgi:hypothetical protein|nr:hypothetical protein [Segeticoccus sp.]
MTRHPAPQRSLAPRSLHQLGLRVLARLYGATDGPAGGARPCDVPEAQPPLSPCR